MTGMTSFQDAVVDAKQRHSPLSILLGNGFSRAFDEAFAYSRLRDEALMTGLSVGKNELFDHAASDDFETVIYNLEHSANLIKLYDPFNTPLHTKLSADAELVKRGLVEALTKNHPPSAPAIPVDKYSSARRFLSHFSRIFTLNYDLLLYWAVLKQLSLSQPSAVQKDGFRRPEPGPLTWSLPEDSDDQEIFYLHGAMHLYIDDGELRKLEYPNGPILEQLKTNLAAGRYPLVVTEGSSINKQARIGRSAYLTYCQTQLSRSRGSLFIHGMAMSENDQHILNSITKGAFDALYVGLHGDPSLNCGMIRARAEHLVRTRKDAGRPTELQFYRAETAAVWG